MHQVSIRFTKTLNREWSGSRKNAFGRYEETVLKPNYDEVFSF